MGLLIGHISIVRLNIRGVSAHCCTVNTNIHKSYFNCGARDPWGRFSLTDGAPQDAMSSVFIYHFGFLQSSQNQACLAYLETCVCAPFYVRPPVSIHGNAWDASWPMEPVRSNYKTRWKEILG